MRGLEHKPWLIALIITTAVVLVIGIILPSINSIDAVVRDSDLFDNQVGNLSDKFYIGITPAGWAFSIWGFIYSFQVVWVLYAHFLICRRNLSGTGYLYYDPPFLAPTTYVLFMFNVVLNLFWLFTWDQEYLAAAFVSLVGSAFCMTLTLVFASRDVYRYESQMRKADVWFNLLFVHNAMALYATWLGVASLINFGIVLRFLAETSDTVASVIPIVMLFAFILVYFILDIIVFTVGARYVFLNYVTWIVALAGVADEHWDQDDGVQVTVVVLLALTVLFTIIKIFVTMYRAIRQPLRFEL